jgi:phosphotransferase system  glucose/maltose/N-acetylglucosamine-specific IIC component
MLIPPDVNSEQEMRWRLALAKSVSNIQTGEQLAAACTLAVGAIIVVGLLYLIVAAKSGIERPVKVYKQRAHLNTQEKRVLTGTAIGLLIVTLLACAIGYAVQDMGIGAATFGISVLVLTIVYELIDHRAEQREKALRQNLLGSETPQLPQDLTLNDVVSWKQTVEETRTQT